MISHRNLSCLPLLASLALSAPAEASALQDAQTLRMQAQRHLLERIGQTYPGVQGRVEMGAVDPRLRLPLCERLEFFLPAGVRLLGSGNLGVRCAGPEQWTLYLGFQIALRGPALVAKRPLGSRQPVMPEEVELREIDYEAAPGEYLRTVEELEGAMTARPFAAGQALTQDRLLRRQTVRAGQRVKVLFKGDGFQVTQEGVALNGAMPGEVVRVRVPSGKLIQGLATVDGQVSMGNSR